MSYAAVRFLIRPFDALQRFAAAIIAAMVGSLLAGRIGALFAPGNSGPGRSLLLLLPAAVGYALAGMLRGPTRFPFAGTIPGLQRRLVGWHTGFIVIGAWLIAAGLQLRSHPVPFRLELGLALLGLALPIPAEARAAQLKYYSFSDFLGVFLLGAALTTDGVFNWVASQPTATLTIAVAVVSGLLIQTYPPRSKTYRPPGEFVAAPLRVFDRVIYSPCLFIGWVIRLIIPLRVPRLAGMLFPFPLAFALATFLILRKPTFAVESSAAYIDRVGGTNLLILVLCLGSLSGERLYSTNVLEPISRRERLERAQSAYRERWISNLLWVGLGAAGLSAAEAWFHRESLSQNFSNFIALLVIDCVLFPALIWIGLLSSRASTVRIKAMIRMAVLSLLVGLVAVFSMTDQRLGLSGGSRIFLGGLLAVALHFLCRASIRSHFLREDLVPVVAAPLRWKEI